MSRQKIIKSGKVTVYLAIDETHLPEGGVTMVQEFTGKWDMLRAYLRMWWAFRGLW